MKSYFISLDVCFPADHLTNFLQSTVPVRRILAHICRIKWNLISFDDENDKRPSINVPTQEKNIRTLTRNRFMPRSSCVVVSSTSW